MPSPSGPLPTAVQFGAGNIGRGFMGELFSRSGYHTLFVDVDQALVAAINTRGAYEIHHVTNAGDEPFTVKNVSALDARDSEAVTEAVAQADLVSTAVGVRALRAVVPVLAGGIAKRLAPGPGAPLNVITCENLIGAGRYLRDLVQAELQARSLVPSDDALDARVGFVEAVVSRMVPIVPDGVRRRDPLWIACEPYARLPVDGLAFRGPVPKIAGLEPTDNILAHQRRKLASHNMSHALCAYLGYQAGHDLIWQAIENPKISSRVRSAMDETGRALCSRFGFDPKDQHDYEEDLLHRYRNRALGDQVRRVTADPFRKLGPEDRLIGSARLCLEEGVEPANVLVGIRAALRYDSPDDPGAVRLQEMLRRRGLAHVLTEVCGLAPDEPLYARLTE